jgi:hypothetical protein
MLEGTLGEMLELQQASEVSRADARQHTKTIGRKLQPLELLVHRQASHHHTPSSSEPAHSTTSTSHVDGLIVAVLLRC